MAVTNFSSKNDQTPPAPAHLSPEAAAWWSAIVASYFLEAHHLKTLQIAAEAWDRSRQARAVLDLEGLTTIDVKGVARPHPCISVERDCAVRFLRSVRELNLDTAPEESRPPAVRHFSRRK